MKHYERKAQISRPRLYVDECPARQGLRDFTKPPTFKRTIPPEKIPAAERLSREVATEAWPIVLKHRAFNRLSSGKILNFQRRVNPKKWRNSGKQCQDESPSRYGSQTELKSEKLSFLIKRRESPGITPFPKRVQ
jgi:hypothetical protein